ncbi:ABC transporter permease [Paenibacillus gansuensis]|uniref:Transport permease protein n=1 Tax=Paenibacillus gansuensis TaxID=306542 RepID=A0ABW5PHG9_9BACL
MQFIYELKNKENYRLLYEMSRKDLYIKYSGSNLGLMWAYIQPFLSILIFWFVFQVGFKSAPVDDIPFILWFITAIVPWFFFSDALATTTPSVVENSYLVKKINFKIILMPLIKIFSSLIIHIFFIMFLFIIFLLYGFNPDLYTIQVFYYLLCSTLLITGLSLITSSLMVFFKDISQIVSMVLQFGFWLTPIFYSITNIPEKYVTFVKLNPLVYIVNGYRDTFIYKNWFWEDTNLMLYFWAITILILSFGVWMFKKLKPHFSDVL